MPDIKVTDEKGVTHIFPDGSTPEMIAKAMNVHVASGEEQALTAAPDATAQARQFTRSQIPSALIPGTTTPDPTGGLRAAQDSTTQRPMLSAGLGSEGFGLRTRMQSPNDYMRESGRLAGETAGTMATGGMYPVVKGAGLVRNLIPAAGRAFAAGLGMGGGALTGGASPGEATLSGAFGAVGQPIGDALAASARTIAPKLAESALNITDRMRGRGRTIGPAVLEETSGLTPGAVAQSSKSAVSNLTGQMQDAVDAATQAGAKGSTQPAHDVLNDALNTLPRNARTLRDKVAGLRDLLDLTPVPPGQARRMIHTPNELLEMKRGIGKEIDTWPPEWQKIPDVQQIKQRLYGALDGELDRLVPGNEELNQTISSLIPAGRQASRIADSSSFAQKMAGRMAAHTGALAASGVGGAIGYHKGGNKGAVIGALTGLMLPEALASPTAQMLAARSFNKLGGANVHYALPWLEKLSDALTANYSQEGQP